VPFDRERDHGDLSRRLAEATHLLSTVPPDESGDPVLDCHGAALGTLKQLRWVGYLSTTGVYGDHGGGWVEEDTALNPTGERGRRRVAAETGWLALHRAHGLPVHIFRLAGIYGPGRNQLEALAHGRARRIVRAGQLFSRIHVDDIVTILMASMAKPNPGAIYNLADDEAAAPEAVIDFAAGLIGVPPPASEAFETAALTEMARSFYADSKRVSNRRIKHELGVRLAYPTYREGLRALHAAMRKE
jgi:nucleoside-diphosphate-sugar epimerase